MEKAWVRVRNIPIEKRCTEHIAYTGALVGITLEVDESTVHKPEYARILLGCREVEKIPPSAEGMLGEQYYDFFYEVEKVVTVGAEKSQSYTAVDSSASPSFPKKARMDSYPASSMGQGETNTSVTGNFSSQNYGKGMQRLPAVAESEEEDESEEGNNTELLIETMAREHAAEKMSYCGSQSDKKSCENVSEDLKVEEMTESPSNEISVHQDYVVWPSLPHIVPLEEGFMEGGENCTQKNGLIKGLAADLIENGVCILQYADDTEQECTVASWATNNYELGFRRRLVGVLGLLKEEERAKLQAGVKRLAHAAAALADRSLPRGRSLLGDREGIQIG
ncbi:uncharacterized protein [Triticum aestivum]|uniref:uncharacterized protein n=1 Tax=Triticum aestivum TaxID=4565 RepID=UPI001D007494|nr:uncharacterized protein LOC123153676 [Triticum aestivum]